MSIICPSVTPTTDSVDEYRQQVERIAPFARRIQIDLMDGLFASPRVLDLADVWWPEEVEADIHLMYQRPANHVETLLTLHPSLVIIHAEAEGQLSDIIQQLQQAGICAGVALLQSTPVESVRSLIQLADHVLVFSGQLGQFGGVADMALLEKVVQIRQIKSDVEIGWDGGANAETVAQLAAGGINIINVGGAIQKADDPHAAYMNLSSLITGADTLS